MDKRRNNILIWLTAWASLLLLVLYSPLGSPDLFKQNSYYYASTNEGRSPYEAKISNGAEFSSIGKDSRSTSVPTYSITNKNRTSGYSMNSAESESKNGNYAQPLPSSTPITKDTKKSVGGNGGFGGGLAGLGNGSNSSTNLSNSGLISMSTDLSLAAENDVTKQGGGLDNPLGTTDPGGDPTGPVIPIPDGWGFLLALALAYGVIKRSFFMKN